jgi:hydrogenase-4 component B
MEDVMANDAFLIAVALWLVAAVAALLRITPVARAALGFGAVAGIAGAVLALPGGSPAATLPLGIAASRWGFEITPAAAWLMLLGLIPAALAGWLASPSRDGKAAWCFGAAASLIGALGVFGLQDAVGFLIAWELMSLGGAAMILGERLVEDAGRPSLFMLALLEVGSVALMVAMLLLATGTHGLSFALFAARAPFLGVGMQVWIGLLLLIGFGAKLGLLPFYEWFPNAYGSASGATGALMSGVVLNAAFFGLARGLSEWLAPAEAGLVFFHGLIVSVGVVSAILTALYAFQQDDWRCLLSFSSAENASLAVMLLGASLMFGRDGLHALAGLAWIVALLHLGGHALAKGALFLTADGVFGATGSYELRQQGLLRRAAWPLGLGALLAGGSLAAMPPLAGFVSEWYLFQTVFQGFHLAGLGDRLLLAAAGAGLALTAAIALAVFVKLLGLGLLGTAPERERIDLPRSLAVGLLGISVTVLAVGMPGWLGGLIHAAPGYADQVAGQMREGWLLVPLTSKFAFISPSKLIIVMPLLSLLPIILLLVSRATRMRRAPVWYGGKRQDPTTSATTALAFSNALREFYSFVYRPQRNTRRELAEGSNGQRYFVRRLTFTHDVAPVFGPLLFLPAKRLTIAAAQQLRRLQSGHLNTYLAFIGILLVLILIVPLLLR